MKFISYLKEMSFREYFFATCMFLAWAAYLLMFIQEPTKLTFVIGNCGVGVCFVILCLMGRKLPSEKVWMRYTDIAFICLLVMYITNCVTAFCCYPSLEQIFSAEFFWLMFTLPIIYLCTAIFFVLGVVGIKDE